MKELDRIKEWIRTEEAQGREAAPIAYYEEFIRPLIEKCRIKDVEMGGVNEVVLAGKAGNEAAAKQIKARQVEARRIVDKMGSIIFDEKGSEAKVEGIDAGKIYDIATLWSFYRPKRGKGYGTPKVIVKVYD
ncbi:hypothetical protein ES703_15327 [subsurface metagenome]